MLIATAGHVDHGKTTLVRALTGVETDRLKEEKARGLSIDLGFAYSNAPGGESIGFVDVPGHEKFIRNMAVGVAAIDLALLIVAADDGVMPQTREHAAILGLFGVSSAVIVVTRIDLVDSGDAIDSAAEAAEQLLVENGIDCRAVHRVSSVNGSGVESLKKELFDFASEAANQASVTGKDCIRCFRMAVDRSFSVAGAGTIVTGTVHDGQMQLNDSLQHLPSKTKLRLKKMHINGREAQESDVAHRGHRVSINLANLGASDLQRGDWIVGHQQSVMTDCIDVEIKLLPNEVNRLKHWSSVHVHFAASSLMARISLYDQRQVEPGESALAQLVLGESVHTVFGDRLILRDSAASHTIGGATVIQPFSSRHRSYRKNRIPALVAQNYHSPVSSLKEWLAISERGVNAEKFRQSRNLQVHEFEQLLSSLDAINTEVELRENSDSGALLFAKPVIESVNKKILSAIAGYHKDNPQEAGMPQKQLFGLGAGHAETVNVALLLLLQSRELARSGNRLKLADFVPQLDDNSSKLLEKIYLDIGPDVTKPPSLSALEESTGFELSELNERVQPLIKAGYLVLVAKNRVYHPQAIQSLVSLAKTLHEENETEGFDAKTFRDHSGIGRNITIEVLEYLDAVGYTRRVGDRRFANPQ